MQDQDSFQIDFNGRDVGKNSKRNEQLFNLTLRFWQDYKTFEKLAIYNQKKKNHGLLWFRPPFRQFLDFTVASTILMHLELYSNQDKMGRWQGIFAVLQRSYSYKKFCDQKTNLTNFETKKVHSEVSKKQNSSAEKKLIKIRRIKSIVHSILKENEI